jgi:hypothetical protein
MDAAENLVAVAQSARCRQRLHRQGDKGAADMILVMVV